MIGVTSGLQLAEITKEPVFALAHGVLLLGATIFYRFFWTKSTG